MSDEWPWHYNPDAEHVASGHAPEVLAEVERLAEQLVILGPDAATVGRGDAGRLLDGWRGFPILAR